MNISCHAGAAGSVDEIMARRQLDANGNHSDEYAINEEMFAMLDYYVAGSFTARAEEARTMATFYKDRVELYKLMDGKPKLGKEVPNWREELTCAIKAFVEAFPDTAGKKRRSVVDIVSVEEDRSMERALAEL